MVRNYKTKTNRANLDENAMRQALLEVFSKRMGQREAARTFNLKRQTLQSRIEKILKTMTAHEYIQKNDDDGYESESEKKGKYATRKIFSSSEEEKIVNYLKQCSNMNYGMTYEQVRVFVYDYAKALPNCKFPEKWNQEKKAGVDWLYCFMKRQTTLSLRKPESTSLARGLGFNKARVGEFFANYQKVLDQYQFTPERIFNLDETGVTTVLSAPKVVAPKGKKQIGLISSAERGELVTFVGIISATGVALPPIYIFPRIRNIEDYLEGAPALSVALGNKSGWMNGDLFVKTLEHIVKYTRCNKENKILLLIDNHESHTTLAAILYARENGIVLLSFPPHTSHKLQPLDIGVFGPFKGKCAISFNDWLSSNPGKTIAVKHIPRLTKTPFLESFSLRNITSSFEKPGIWPLNSLAFSESDFDATLVYNDPQTSIILQTCQEKVNEGENANLTDVNINTEDIRNMPSTSGIKKITPVLTEEENVERESETLEKTDADAKNNLSNSVLSPESVRPYPKVEKQKNVTRRPKANQGKSRVYTETPEKNRIEEIEEGKLAKQKNIIEKQKRKLMKNDLIKAKKVKLAKKKIFDSSSSESEYSNISFGSETDDNLSLGSLDDSDDIEVNSFILVKFTLKNALMHYVGQVRSIISDNLYEVKYLRRRAKTNKFYFPQVEDIERCSRDSISAILKNAIKSRRDSNLTFHYNFDGLNVK